LPQIVAAKNLDALRIGSKGPTANFPAILKIRAVLAGIARQSITITSQ
jgi:hypothetical protein